MRIADDMMSKRRTCAGGAAPSRRHRPSVLPVIDPKSGGAVPAIRRSTSSFHLLVLLSFSRRTFAAGPEEAGF